MSKPIKHTKHFFHNTIFGIVSVSYIGRKNLRLRYNQKNSNKAAGKARQWPQAFRSLRPGLIRKLWNYKQSNSF